MSSSSPLHYISTNKVININTKSEIEYTFKDRLSKIIEIKIYLTENFKYKDVDNKFMKDIENEYAEKMCLKMDMIPTISNIRKILNVKPLELCDFNITTEIDNIDGNEKLRKIVHIYPNAVDRNKKIKSNQNKNEDNIINNWFKINKPKENNIKLLNSKICLKSSENDLKKCSSPKMKISKNDDMYDYLNKKEEVDKIIRSAKDDIIDKKYFSTSSDKMDIDLSTDNIRKKYIILNKKCNKNEYRIYHGNAIFFNISKSSSMRKNILNDSKYELKVNELKGLNNEILYEIHQPFIVQLEIIMKDLNYIIDNFPLDDFITTEEEGEYHLLNEENKPNSKNILIYKIKVNSKNDIKEIYEQMEKKEIARLIGLTLNLIYWIIFGSMSWIQIDINTKQFLLLKILKEFRDREINFKDKKLYNKVFVPLFIIIMRIEAENYFRRKFKLLFMNESNKKKCLDIINDVITEIFDKHSFYNSFGTICGNSDEFKLKVIKNEFPRFKSKLFATSNMLEQIFCNDNSYIKNDYKKLKEKDLQQKIEQNIEYLKEKKVNFFTYFLDKINTNLRKRKIEHSFSIKKNKDIYDINRINTSLSSNITSRKLSNSLQLKISNEYNTNNTSNINTNISTIPSSSDNNSNVVYYIEHSKLKNLKNIYK